MMTPRELNAMDGEELQKRIDKCEYVMSRHPQKSARARAAQNRQIYLRYLNKRSES